MTKKSFKNWFLLVSSFLVLLTFSCDKENFLDDTDAKLEFTTDTLSFDTVFTTVGSITKFFKVINPYNEDVQISDINLAGGEQSQFRINIDGNPVTSATNVPIEAEDSLYIYVEVTVDPNAADLPFLIQDSIVFNLNGNIQDVDLLAYGQNANFFGNVAICDEVWTNELPYVLYDTIYVEPGCKLTIEPGTRIYSHVGSQLFVGGTLEVNGGTDSLNRVVFQGDRLDEGYRDLPGQWGGIHILRGSVDNVIQGAEIKNGLWGVRVDSLAESGGSNILIKDVIIENMSAFGIWGITASIEAENTLIYDCGLNNLNLEFGGFYNFQHCTFANRGSFFVQHKNPILRGVNYLAIGQSIVGLADFFDLNMLNCIIDGTEEEEVFLDELEPDDLTVNFNYEFKNCLIKSDEEYNTESEGFVNCIFNPSPNDTLFIDYSEGDLHLNALAPVIDQGDPSTAGTFDLDSNPRDATPDIGCYEFGF